MQLRIHADELGPSGGSRVAAELRSLGGPSSRRGRRPRTRLRRRRHAPAERVLLKLPIAPEGMLIEQGVPVALATDVNPGAGFSPSMPFAMALGCFSMGLTFEEALVAATINAAYSLDRHARVGSLEAGKQMDAVVVAGPAIDLIRVGAQRARGRQTQGWFE